MEFNFSDADMSAMIQEMENEKNKNTFVSPYWKPVNEGTYNLRFITPLKQFGEKVFYQKHRMHYINDRAYFCLNQTLKDKNGNIHEAEECPICKKVQQLYRLYEKGSEETKIASKIAAKDRFVSRVIVRGNKTADNQPCEFKPEFYEFGKKIHEYFFNVTNSGDAGNWISLKEGRDYILSKKGTGRNTDYSGSMLSMKQSPIFTDTEDLKKLLEYLPKMEYSQLVSFVTADEMSKALNEFFSEESKEVDMPAPAPIQDIDPMSGGLNPTVDNSSSTGDSDIDQLLGMI